MCPYCQKRLMARHVGPLILAAEDLVPGPNVDNLNDHSMDSAQNHPVQATRRARAESMDESSHLNNAAQRKTRVASLCLGKIFKKMNLFLI